MRADGRRRRGMRERARAAPADRPQDLIHTTNSPKQATARVPGRFGVSIRDPEGLPLGDVFRVISGELSPLEFLAMRRAADATNRP